jgi:hypothetical protein
MEAATLRNTPQPSSGDSSSSLEDRCSSQSPLSTLSRNVIQVSFRSSLAAAIVIVVAASMGAASTAPPQKIVSQRTARTIPHRFTITPMATTLTANQVQHFGVTDAEGNSVAVTWNLSGIGCAGVECGTIDADGNYRPPAALHQSRVVILEGVVASDPNYSVLTRIQLVPGGNPNSVLNAASVPAKPVPTMRPLTLPPVGRPKQQTDAELMPLPPPVAAAPGAGKRNLATHGELPLPRAIDAPPAVTGTSVGAREHLPPLPTGVSAPPSLGNSVRDGAAAKDFQMSANVVAPPPTADRPTIVGKREGLPLPTAVDGPLPGSARNNISTSEQPASSSGVSAAGSVKNVGTATSALISTSDESDAKKRKGAARERGKDKDDELSVVMGPVPVVRKDLILGNALTPAPGVIAPPPSVSANSNVVARAELPPSSQAITAAPVVNQNLQMEPKALALANVAAPAATQIDSDNSRQDEPTALPKTIASASLVHGSTTSHDAVLPLSKTMPAAHAAGDTSEVHGSVVRYKDGELTIDANNETMAEVLELIAKKTGAVIDVPEGTGLEHIFEHAGPGKPNDVLTQLLNGSHYNFIIVNSPLNPSEPAQVLLSVQRADAGTDAPAPPAPVSSGLYTPPDPTLRPQVLGAQYDSALQAPSEPVTPEALGEMMKQKARELRDRTEQLGPPQ